MLEMFSICGDLLLSTQPSCIRYTWVRRFTLSHTHSIGFNRRYMDTLASRIANNGCCVLPPLDPNMFLNEAKLGIFIYLGFFSIRRLEFHRRIHCHAFTLHAGLN